MILIIVADGGVAYPAFAVRSSFKTENITGTQSSLVQRKLFTSADPTEVSCREGVIVREGID